MEGNREDKEEDEDDGERECREESATWRCFFRDWGDPFCLGKVAVSSSSCKEEEKKREEEEEEEQEEEWRDSWSLQAKGDALCCSIASTARMKLASQRLADIEEVSLTSTLSFAIGSSALLSFRPLLAASA